MKSNSPSGEKTSEFSSFHRGIPNPNILLMYLEEKQHNAITKLNPLIKDLIKNIKNKKLLDIGCGIGSVLCQGLIYYGLNPKNLYSLDQDPKNFENDEYSRENKVVCKAENLPFESNFFDVVHSNELTLDNPDLDYLKVLKEICRVLKPNGFYIANEHFDQVEEMKKINENIKNNFKEIIKNKNLASIGFKPLIRAKYLDSPKIGKYQFIFY